MTQLSMNFQLQRVSKAANGICTAVPFRSVP